MPSPATSRPKYPHFDFAKSNCLGTARMYPLIKLFRIRKRHMYFLNLTSTPVKDEVKENLKWLLINIIKSVGKCLWKTIMTWSQRIMFKKRWDYRILIAHSFRGWKNAERKKIWKKSTSFSNDVLSYWSIVLALQPLWIKNSSLLISSINKMTTALI